jgi:hypothetical protein
MKSAVLLAEGFLLAKITSIILTQAYVPQLLSSDSVRNTHAEYIE